MLFQNSSYLSCHVLHMATTPLKYLLLVTVSVCRTVLVAQSCLALCVPKDCSLPGFSVHGILQARILEWIAIPFFPTQRLNPGLLPCKQIIYHLSYREEVTNSKWPAPTGRITFHTTSPPTTKDTTQQGLDTVWIYQWLLAEPLVHTLRYLIP